MIEHMAGRTDDTFFMSWLAVAFSTFLAPTTALKLIPKCYGLVLDHQMLKNTNICLFVAEHINEAFRNMDQEKQTVCCCLYHLMILYLDALVHDIPVSNCAIRSNAWDSTLIAKVIKKDTISPEEYRGTEQTPLFGGILQAEAFVASKLPITYNPQKKAKIAKVVNELCKAEEEEEEEEEDKQEEDKGEEENKEEDSDADEEEEEGEAREGDGDKGAAVDGSERGEDKGAVADGSEREEDEDEEDEDEEDEDDYGDDKGGSNGGSDSSDDDDDDNAPGSGGTSGNTSRRTSTHATPASSSNSLSSRSTLQLLIDKTCWKDKDLPKSKKNDEAESQGSIDMFKLCNLKPALPTTFPVPDFSDKDMCEKINFAIDKSLFLSTEAEKNQIDMEEARKGLDWVHSKEKYKEYLKQLPDLSSSKSKAASTAKPHVVQKCKAVSMKKNLQLPQTKEKMVSEDAEVNMVKEAVLQTDMPTVVSREPTNVREVQQIKGKTPLSTVPPKPPKQKIVKFARGAKGEQATKGVPSSARLLPTQTGKMPTTDTSVPTDVSVSSMVTVKTTTASQEGTTATASPKVPTDRDASMPNTKGGDPTIKVPSPRVVFQQPLTQEEVFDIICRCKPPRLPTTTLLRTKSVNDAPMFLPQGDALVLEPLRRSNSYHGDGFCDAPSFDLGIDGDAPAPALAVDTAEAGVISIDECELDPVAVNEGCDPADVGKAIAQELDVGSPENCHTPICAEPELGMSTSQRSPFIDYNKNKTFSTNEAVNKLYAALLYWARHHKGANDGATSPEIIRYGAFYISLKELVDSMKPVQWLSKIVIETGILHIMDNLPEGSKKVVMPLRFSIKLQQGIHNVDEMNKKFDYKNRLDKKDLVMLPVLECADVTDKDGGTHYWVFSVNLRDGRFEVLDSSRTLDNIELMNNASTIAGAVRQLWRKHYPKFSIEHFQIIDIDVPKQLGNNECGLFALLNATEWNGSQLPNYDPKEVLNIRKKLTYDWVTSVHNTAPWRKLLRYDKE
ncbi:unnamed protein product [Triticum turgidum subsp. durum]|uniref:Ubiquitin-like protease family profile domain-containing protein n=1 Tax=Triticum turgidum subsp. durum TaxID=4567 RepID=A0A9R0VIP8_TRITD|nr:unnamed protein product [Triticum turgidum subsp. durum]